MYTSNLFGEQKILYDNVHGCARPSTRPSPAPFLLHTHLWASHDKDM